MQLSQSLDGTNALLNSFRFRPQHFAAPDVTPRPHSGTRGIAMILASMLAILSDQTATAIAGTGLPYLQGITATSPDEASWIVTAFNACYYAFVLCSPWMMARIGRRRLLMAALVGFAATSLILSFVMNIEMFVALRALQGACLGCVFVPAAILLFTSLPVTALKFAPPAFVLVSLTGGTLGTVISGYIADTFGGRFIFLPGCIATAVTAFIIRIAVDSTDLPQRNLSFDRIGVGLSVVSFGLMQFLSNEGERRNWFDDGTIVVAFALLAITLPAFVLYELFGTRNPHVNFRMFTEYPNLSVGGVVNIIVGATGYSVTALVAFVEGSLAATPTVAGQLVLVRLVTYAVGVPLAFFFVIKKILDIRAIVSLGVIGSACGLLAFSQSMTATADIATFFGLSLFFGLFFGIMNQPLGALVIGSMPLPLLAAGVSIYKLSSPIGAMISTGIMQTIFDHESVAVQTRLSGAVVRARPGIAAYLEKHHGNASGLVGVTVAQAHAAAYAHIMWILAFMLLAVIPIAYRAKIKKVERPPVNV